MSDSQWGGGDGKRGLSLTSLMGHWHANNLCLDSSSHQTSVWCPQKHLVLWSVLKCAMLQVPNVPCSKLSFLNYLISIIFTAAHEVFCNSPILALWKVTDCKLIRMSLKSCFNVSFVDLLVHVKVDSAGRWGWVLVFHSPLGGAVMCLYLPSTPVFLSLDHLVFLHAWIALGRSGRNVDRLSPLFSPGTLKPKVWLLLDCGRFLLKVLPWKAGWALSFIP